MTASPRPEDRALPAHMRRRTARGLVLVALLALCPACGDAPAPGPAAQATVPSGPSEPGEIELSDPVVTMVDAKRVRFEVKYRFTKGRPSKYYLCEIAFPGTANHGAKPMETFEMKPEGVIADRVTLSKPPVQTFEIRVSEADSPQDGYKLISNVVSGAVK